MKKKSIVMMMKTGTSQINFSLFFVFLLFCSDGDPLSFAGLPFLLRGQRGGARDGEVKKERTQ